MTEVLAAGAWRTNADLIADVARLYLRPDDRVLDMTPGRTAFWWNRHRPTHLELLPAGADFRAAPYGDCRFEVVAFDPPYVAMGGRETSTLGDMTDRYGMIDAPKDPGALRSALLRPGLRECARVATRGGLVWVKCQDYVSGGRLQPGTNWMIEDAKKMGLRYVDRFEHVTKVRPQPKGRTRKCRRCKGTGWIPDDPRAPDGSASGCPICTPPDGCGGTGRVPTEQQHARRNLSTLLIFRKARR